MQRLQRLLLVLMVLAFAGLLSAQHSDPPPRKVTPEQQAKRLTRQLELPDRCSFAWRGLLTIGAPAAVPLAATTRDPRPEVALRAFMLLGMLGKDGEAALPTLREHTTGKDAQLAYAVSWAIQRIEFRGRLLTDYGTCTVEQIDDDGKVVRKLEKLSKPWHAEPAGDGRLLVSEYGGNCVREFDAAGKEVWKYEGLNNPYHTQRLPSGNTVISDAGNNRVIEVDRSGQTVWEQKDLKRPVAAVRTPDGHTLIVEQNGDAFELDQDRKEIWRFATPKSAMHAERLLNGNTLLAVYHLNQVMEIDLASGEAQPAIAAPQAQVALRRRDGHTLIAATNCWLELDTAGKEVWRREASYATSIYW